MNIEFKPLHPTFAAEVTGVTVSKGLSSAALEQVREYWNRYKLLIFPHQNPQETDLVEFSRFFGELEIHVRKEYLSPDNPELLYVSNKQQNGASIGILSDTEVGWHYDQIYLPRPAIGSLLCAVEVPPKGQGNTYFADMVSAYASLPERTKQKLAGRNAVQSYAAFNRMYSVPTNQDQTKKTPDIEHPIVRAHPVTGEQALYLCPGMTTRIVGMAERDSRALLDELFEWIVRDEFVYCHQWAVGDCVMWDNACTMHKRDPFDRSQQRLMKRSTILPPAERAVPVGAAGP